MNRLIVFLLFIGSASFGQELKLMEATKQIINSGAAPTSTTNYKIQFQKNPFKWSVDSVVNVYTGKSVQYTIVQINDPNLPSPDIKPVKCFSKKDKGIYWISFASSKNRGGGRPGSPTGVMVELPDFPKGAIIYYRSVKKKKQLLVETFTQLETINAP
jgi:hypothetical protein